VRDNTHSRFFKGVIQRSSVVERSAINFFRNVFHCFRRFLIWPCSLVVVTLIPDTLMFVGFPS
jgi:hypothetical protein